MLSTDRIALPPNQTRTLELGRRLAGYVPPRDAAPVVSVITVVYNNAATLQRCIDSVTTQQGVAVEYIVIDGGSTDGTLDVIRANSSYIDYAVSEPDRGIYDAMNKGISLARGDYIALINSDDWLEPDGLQVSIENMRMNAAEVSIGFANVWDKHGKFSHVWKIGNFDARIMTSGMSFCHQALIASRRAYETVGPFDDTIRISADYKWIKKLYLSGLKAVFTELPVVNFSFDGVAANNRPIWKQECKALLTEQFPFLAPEDVSAFLEYVYRDAPLDQNAVENLVMCAGESPLLLQSLSLVLLDRLFAHEMQKKHIVSIRNRVPRREHVRGLLTVDRKARMEDRPKISVVIPVYNVEAYLEQCLRSVMEQSLREIEIICVNDGSPDGCQTILERLAAEDRRIRIIVKENGGVSSARNVGIRAATGDYVHLLDSDDYIRPGMYEALYTYAFKNQLELVKSNLGFIDDVYPMKRPLLPKTEVFTFADCPACAQFITPCGALYSRMLLERVSPFVEGMIYEDRPFNWETLIEARRIGHVDEVFYMYRVGRPGSIMSTRQGNLRHFDGFRAIDKIRDLLDRRGLLEKFKLEFVKEQLRLYSMLIDIDAIPRAAYGRFFWEMRERIDATQVPMDEVLETNLPPRAKALYAFLASSEPHDARAVEGEKYFFHGIDYATTTATYTGSSCELFLIAEHAIEHRASRSSDDTGDRFRKAIALSLLFDNIHFGALDTTVDVLRALDEIEKVIAAGGALDALLAALHDPGLPHRSRTVRHLAFQYSQSGNYQACRQFLESYAEARGEAMEFVDIEQVNNAELPPAIAAPRRAIINAIKSAGLRPYAFSMVADTAYHTGCEINIQAVETLTVLFPNSAPERYLIELLRGRCRIVFLPHGLPQLSMATARPDIVLSLTEEDTWLEVFPHARVVYAGWPDVFRQKPLSAPQAPESQAAGKAKTILFLSQIAGSGIHKLDDLVEVASHFVTFALSDRGRDYDIIVRLRDKAELGMLDEKLVGEIEDSPNISISELSDVPAIELTPDLIVSASSTGLLYAPAMGVPLLQLTTRRILQHWPFVFGGEANIHFAGDSVTTIAKKIETLLGGGSDWRGKSRHLSEAEAFASLDSVYRFGLSGRSEDARAKALGFSNTNSQIISLVAKMLLAGKPTGDEALERLLAQPDVSPDLSGHALRVRRFLADRSKDRPDDAE